MGLVGKCLQHVLQQGATVILVTPLWPTQAWYPAPFPLLFDYPRVLPQVPDLMICPVDNKPLPKRAQQLVAWYVSGDHSRTQEFQKTHHVILERVYNKELQLIMESLGTMVY